MGGLLDAMTQEKLDNQRDVVKNERRQRYDNQPYGTAFEKIFANIYPKDHPITGPPSIAGRSFRCIDGGRKGILQDLLRSEQCNARDRRRFNEVRRVSGREIFRADTGRRTIKRPTPTAPKIEGEVRKTFEDSVQLPRLYMVWTSAAAYSADEPALDVMTSICLQVEARAFRAI